MTMTKIPDSHEAYANYVRQVLKAAGWPWPEDIVLDPCKSPRIITDVDEVMHEIQCGRHLDDIVVFWGGLDAVGQSDALHESIALATGLRTSQDGYNADFACEREPRTVYDVLQRLARADGLKPFKGKVTYRQSPRSRRSVSAESGKNAQLAPKWECLKAVCPEESRSTVYMAEVRCIDPRPCAVPNVPACGLDRHRRTSLSTTLRERLSMLGMDVESMLYWDDYSEGMFVGSGESGYVLHADSIPTSNVGTVFAGHKLLAVWSFPDDSKTVTDRHGRANFVAPLTDEQICSLRGACRIALAPPGSVYIFSGMNAHAVCNVSFGPPGLGQESPRPSLVVSSYEAFTGLNLNNAKAMMQACHDDSLDDSDIDDLRDFEEELACEAWKLYERLRANKVVQGVHEAYTVVKYLLSVSPYVRRYFRQRDYNEADVEEVSPKQKRIFACQ